MKAETLSIMNKIKDTWKRQIEGDAEADSPRNISHMVKHRKQVKGDSDSIHLGKAHSHNENPSANGVISSKKMSR